MNNKEPRLRQVEDQDFTSSNNAKFILETLHDESAGEGLSEENKLRLIDAYLDIESDDEGSG